MTISWRGLFRRGVREARGVPLRRFADHLVVGDPDGTVTGDVLPPEPGVTLVVVPDEPRDWGAVVEAIAGSVPAGTPCRLVASGAALAAGPGSPAPAELLARRLSCEVFAAAGLVLAGAGRSAFATGGGWLRIRPDGGVARSGWRCPSPWWESALADVDAHAPDRVRVVQVPAGIQVCADDDGNAIEVPLGTVYETPTSHTRVVLFVGRHGCRPPAVDAVVRVADALPAEVREHLVVVPHSIDAGDALAVADRVADRIGTAVATC